MPNTEVKLTNAESTWLEAAREDRKLLIDIKKDTQRSVFFSCVVMMFMYTVVLQKTRFKMLFSSYECIMLLCICI